MVLTANQKQLESLRAWKESESMIPLVVALAGVLHAGWIVVGLISSTALLPVENTEITDIV
jgi:hypothetical protein